MVLKEVCTSYPAKQEQLTELKNNQVEIKT